MVLAPTCHPRASKPIDHKRQSKELAVKDERKGLAKSPLGRPFGS